jgi:site-specific recombinase XerC
MCFPLPNQVSDDPALLANREILHFQPADHIRGKRDRAILALLIGCGLRRAALVGLRDWDFMWPPKVLSALYAVDH